MNELFTELFAKYSCTNCQEEIVGVTVHCSECEDFSLCLQVSFFFVRINAFLLVKFLPTSKPIHTLTVRCSKERQKCLTFFIGFFCCCCSNRAECALFVYEFRLFVNYCLAFDGMMTPKIFFSVFCGRRRNWTS